MLRVELNIIYLHKRSNKGCDCNHQSPFTGEGVTRRNMELESPKMQEAQRTPAAQRLGTASSSRKRNPPRAASMKAAQPKPPAKRATTGKVTGAARTRGNSSPLQGVRTTKQRATRGRPPARKRLCVERTSQAKDLPLNKDTGAPSMVNVAGTNRGRVDFHGPPDRIL